MMNNRRLSFSQRQGLAEIPQALKHGELPSQFRNQVWGIFHNFFSKYYKEEDWNGNTFLTGDAYNFMKEVWVEFLDYPVDEYTGTWDQVGSLPKDILLKFPYNETFDFLEFAMECKSKPYELEEQINALLEKHHVAYRLNGTQFFPISSVIQGDMVLKDLNTVNSSGFKASQEHLRKASEHLNRREWPASVRESIHSVESIVCIVTGEIGAPLSKALTKLEQSGVKIHPALRGALDKMYAYTSDERGVRHSAITDEANVDEIEAMFLFSACASFCSYLIGKAAQAGINV